MMYLLPLIVIFVLFIFIGKLTRPLERYGKKVSVDRAVQQILSGEREIEDFRPDTSGMWIIVFTSLFSIAGVVCGAICQFFQEGTLFLTGTWITIYLIFLIVGYVIGIHQGNVFVKYQMEIFKQIKDEISKKQGLSKKNYEASINFCPKCGNRIINQDKFCPHCGNDLLNKL